MKTPPFDVLKQLGRLNAHASAHDPWRSSGASKAVYAYKLLATLKCFDAGEAVAQLVRWRGKCNRCTDGWFWRDYPEDKVRCRHCDGRGNVTLRFLSSALPDWQRWFHPIDGGGAGCLIAQHLGMAIDDSATWEDAGDWSPGIRREALPLTELVPALNIVERWVDSIEQPKWPETHYWPIKHARDCLRTHRYNFVVPPLSHGYRLDLGLAAGGCWKCGTTEDMERVRLGRFNLYFHWSHAVCRAHYGRDARPSNSEPPSTLISPAIADWLVLHSQVEEIA